MSILVLSLLGVAIRDHAAWWDVVQSTVEPVLDSVLAKEDVDARLLWDVCRYHVEQGRTLSQPLIVCGLVPSGTEMARPKFSADATKWLTDVLPASAIPTPLEIDGWLSELISTAQRTSARAAIREAQNDLTRGADVDTVIETAHAAFASLPSRRSLPPPMGRKYAGIFELSPDRFTIPTGFADVDAKLGGGFDAGDYAIIGARPNVGKSAILLALARAQIFPAAALNWEEARQPLENRLALQTGEPVQVLYLSLEMPTDKLLQRLSFDLLNIDATEWRRDQQDAIRKSQLVHEYGIDGYLTKFENSAAKLTIIDRKSLGDASASAIVRTSRQWIHEQRRESPHARLLVLVDYAQKITTTENEAAGMNRQRQLAIVSDQLYALSKSENTTIVCAAQIGRAADEHEPNSQELRESGDFGQDADHVILLHCLSPGQRDELDKGIKNDGEPKDPPKLSARQAKLKKQREEAGEPEPEEEPDSVEDFSITSSIVTYKRAASCLMFKHDKGRSAETGWRMFLNFDRPHQRLTDGWHEKDKHGRSVNVDYIRHRDVVDLLRPPSSNSKGRS